MSMYSDSYGQNNARRHYPAQQEDMYAEDTERLYESFNDLYEDFDDGRSKTPFVIIGALLAIGIVGGGLAFAYQQGFGGTSSSGEVPVVVADSEPSKVEPQEPGGMEIPHQDSLIFNRINGEDAGDNGTTSAAMSEEGNEPDEPPLTIGDLASQVTDGQTPDRPIAMGDTPAAQGETLLSPAGGGQQAELPKPLLPPGSDSQQTPTGGSDSAVLSPRKVETFTITPDGRIVSQTVDAPQQPAGPQSNQTASLDVPALPSALEPVDQPSDDPNGGETIDLSATGDARPQVPSLPGSGTSDLAPSPQPKPRPTTRDLAALQEAQQARQASAPQTASRQAPSQPAAAAPSNDAGLDGKFAVQVASNQRQADSLAIFADLQRRYPNLVSGYRPLIQRADLGSRGIFYRLRIGPLDTKAAANELCGSLRNAGLPGCIVRTL